MREHTDSDLADSELTDSEFTDSEFTDTDATGSDLTDSEDFLRGGEPGLAPGESLAPGYTAISHLHRSNKFDVYDAWSEERAARCIVKTPTPERLENKSVARGLFREGRLLAKFTHPHIVRAYETIREPRPAVVFETLTGATLSHLIDTRERRLPLKDIAHLGLHICSAVHYLHHHGILHLDLKPSNIVSERGVAKIIDLSIARKPGRGKKGEGTLHYISPEQIRGDSLGPAADVWGIGAVLFEATADEPPFNAYDPETGEDDDYEQLGRRAEPLGKHRRVPKELSRIIEECLDPDSEKRPSVPELSRRLGEFAEIKAF